MSDNEQTPDTRYVEDDDVEWIEVDCVEYDRIRQHFGHRDDFSRTASPAEREKLSVHSTFTDPEGRTRSLTVWGNKTLGAILRWTGYLGRGYDKTECRHWVGAHVGWEPTDDPAQ